PPRQSAVYSWTFPWKRSAGVSAIGRSPLRASVQQAATDRSSARDSGDTARTSAGAPISTARLKNAVRGRRIERTLANRVRRVERDIGVTLLAGRAPGRCDRGGRAPV